MQVALEHCHAAIRLRPSSLPAKYNLALALNFVSSEDAMYKNHTIEAYADAADLLDEVLGPLQARAREEAGANEVETDARAEAKGSLGSRGDKIEMLLPHGLRAVMDVHYRLGRYTA
jgi:hypothetical protein